MKKPRIVRNTNFLPFPVFYLFEWMQDQSSLLNTLLVSLKNPGTPMFHQEFSKLLAIERGFVDKCEFVPVPPSIPADRDHAFYLASELSKIYRTETHCLLQWQHKDGKQRKKGKKDRGKGKIVASARHRKVFENQRVILIDDIVTTGFTALKAYEALGKPKDIELWCLACRYQRPLV